LYRAISKGGILRNIAAKNKQELIKLVMQQSASRLGLDPHVIAELLIDRESLMSTALNYGLAVPHPRDLVLSPTDADKIITVFPETPIDYGALDGEAVHTLFFLFSSSDKKHLHLLSKLAHLGSQPCAIDFLASKPTPEALLAYIKEWETKVENKPHNPNPKRRQ
jgi:PTS system nitrogen regulatory IIA component